jgi:hypothetical protein
LYNLLNIILLVRFGAHNQHPIQQIDRQPMRALKLRSPDPRHALIRRHDHQRRQLALQRSIQKREALDIQHMYLVNEQNSRNDLCLAFLAPFSDFGVDLCAQLGFDLARVPCEEGEEALSA